VATGWTPSLVGRFLYVTGAARPYEISAIDPVGQVATLLTPYADPTQAYALYAIRSAPAERQLVYYSEPGQPEVWPPWNAVEMPNDSDEPTALLVKSSYFNVIKQRHIYRLVMDSDPSQGRVFLQLERGCVNARCHVTVEETTYMLDEVGIHAFGGNRSESQSKPISGPIQNLFQADPTSADNLQVDWSSDATLWHAAHDPTWNTIRWFVPMVGDTGINHAICYDYRQSRWWIEAYPTSITASAAATIDGRRSLVGTEARRVPSLGHGITAGAERCRPFLGHTPGDGDVGRHDHGQRQNCELRCQSRGRPPGDHRRHRPGPEAHGCLEHVGPA